MFQISLNEKILTELTKRKSFNKSYSLRALARDFNVDHSLLSRILSFKLDMTVQFFEKIAMPLNLSDAEKRFYKTAIEEKKRKTDGRRIERVQSSVSF